MFKFIRSKLILSYTSVFIILTISLFLILLFGSIPPFNHWTVDQRDLNSSLFADYGQFISGFLGTLVSLLSFILLFKSLTEQRQQFTIASFQNNFYSLLENHRNILNSICDKVDDVSSEEERGADFFADLAQRIFIDFNGKEQEIDGKKVKPCYNPSLSGSIRLVAIYNYYFNIHHSDLGHYFRNLYHFVRFILESEVDNKIKERHIKILRAQLSNYEMLILAYNCLHKYGKKFKPFVENHELLQNLNFELELDSSYVSRIIDPQILIREYPHLENPYMEQKSALGT